MSADQWNDTAEDYVVGVELITGPHALTLATAASGYGRKLGGKDALYLDVACGTGAVALPLAKMVAPATVHASDFSEHMVSITSRQARSQHLDNLKVSVEDCQKLSLGDESVHVVTSSFGITILDPVMKKRGISEAHRVLVPGGRLILSAWSFSESNPLLLNEQLERLSVRSPLVKKALAKLPGHVVGGVHGADDLKMLLCQAGFMDVHVRTMQHAASVPDAANFARQLFSNPFMVNLLSDFSDEERAVIHREMVDMLVEESDGGVLVSHTTAYIAIGRKRNQNEAVLLDAAPFIFSRDCKKHVAWLVEALGATASKFSEDPTTGLVMYVCVTFGSSSSRVYMCDNVTEQGTLDPDASRTEPRAFYMHINTDNAFLLESRALLAGGTSIEPVKSTPYGMTYGRIRDPYGLEWGLSHREIKP